MVDERSDALRPLPEGAILVEAPGDDEALSVGPADEPGIVDGSTCGVHVLLLHQGAEAARVG
jgi:hypothetical protein